jgi:hypothetical protein
MYRLIHPDYLVYWASALISITLSLWINHHVVLLNPDAICYLQSAETFSHQGLLAAMSLCGQSQWPFYYVFIAGIVKLTGFSYEHSAFILNGIFSVLTVLIFIRIVSLFSHKKTVLGFAALIILLFHEWNSIKSDVIRDHGFWFFYLLSIFFLLQYVRQKTETNAVLWGVSLVMATLFRIESIIFLAFIPWIIFFENESYIARAKHFLQLNSVLFLTAIVLLAAIMVHPNLYLNRLNEFREHIQISHLIHHYMVLADGLGQSILGRSFNDRYIIYFLMLLGWYLWMVVSTLSFIYFVLILFSWGKKLLPPFSNMRLVLWSYVAINVFITFIFLVENQFLSKRYLLALALTTMIWIPFSLEYLSKQWIQRKWPLILVLFGIGAYGLSGIVHLSDSKQYVRDAGDWLQTHVPVVASIYSNDYQLMYYSHHFENDIFVKQHEFSELSSLQNNQWKRYDYLALHLNEKTLLQQAALLDQMKDLPVIVFNGKHHQEQIRIYQKVSS